MERLLLAVLLVVWCRVTVATVMLCYACFPTCSEDNDDTTECSGSCWNYTTTDTHGSSGTWSVQLHTIPECSGSCWTYTTTDTHGSSDTWSYYTRPLSALGPAGTTPLAVVVARGAFYYTQAWRKKMTACRRVYDSRHLQADCQGPKSAPEPYAR